jgi:DNA integrity scanning protein DisA with diadenylate cyclase activity
MTPKHESDRITVREFFLEMNRQNERRDDMEKRLISEFNKSIEHLQEKINGRICVVEETADALQASVSDLRVADRKWGGIAAIVAAAFAGIGAGLGAYLRK